MKLPKATFVPLWKTSGDIFIITSWLAAFQEVCDKTAAWSVKEDWTKLDKLAGRWAKPDPNARKGKSFVANLTAYITLLSKTESILKSKYD